MDMKFVLAPDSFKESMTAKKAALAMERGIRAVYPDAECRIVPMADGGEGTVESLVSLTKGNIIEAEVLGPLGEKTIATYGVTGEGSISVIEMASASGLELLRLEERNPRKCNQRWWSRNASSSWRLDRKKGRHLRWLTFLTKI
jgi:glycerate 2-kinase